ncbi:MAG: peptide-binding protein [Gemmatimonadaceae bacterium]
MTLTLDPSLRWHDGIRASATDAKFTLDAVRDTATRSPRAAELAPVTGVSVADDTTLIVEFRVPQAAFPLVLCDLPIVPAHLLARVPRPELRRAPFGLAPVGSGPFRFSSRAPGREWTFTRNAEFPAALGGPPDIERLVMVIVDEASTKFAGLVSGDLDIAGIALSMANRVAADPRLRVVTYPTLAAVALVFNTTRAPMNDARVRRAVSLSLDRGRIVRTALSGFGTPSASPLPPSHPYASDVGPDTDLVLADSLLSAAGWVRDGDVRRRAGKSLTLDLVTVGTGDNALEQLIQADLGGRGVAVSIRQVDMAALVASARSADKKYDAVVTSVPGDLALAYLSSMFDSQYAGGGLDYAAYHTPRLDSLLRAARDPSDPRGSRNAWAAVQGELLREAPAAWVYHARGVQGVSRRLRGVVMDLRGELPSLSAWTTSDAADGARRATHR